VGPILKPNKKINKRAPERQLLSLTLHAITTWVSYQNHPRKKEWEWERAISFFVYFKFWTFNRSLIGFNLRTVRVINVVFGGWFIRIIRRPLIINCMAVHGKQSVTQMSEPPTKSYRLRSQPLVVPPDYVALAQRRTQHVLELLVLHFQPFGLLGQLLQMPLFSPPRSSGWLPVRFHPSLLSLIHRAVWPPFRTGVWVIRATGGLGVEDGQEVF